MKIKEGWAERKLGREHGKINYSNTSGHLGATLKGTHNAFKTQTRSETEFESANRPEFVPNKAKMLKNILNEPVDIMPKEAKIGPLASRAFLDRLKPTAF